MRSESTRHPARDRSITLLHVFLLASGVILLIAALVLSFILGSAVHKQASSDVRNELSRAADMVIGPPASRNSESLLDARSSSSLRERFLGNPAISRVEIIRGARLPASSAKPDQVAIDVPIRGSDGTRPIGYYRVFSNPLDIERTVASRELSIWIMIALVFLALYGALALLVRGASNSLKRRGEALRMQKEALLDAYRRLEQSSLEAIESLNATVDAKDPSTAGHSQRVVAIALAIGREVGLDPARLELLRLGALFHDIGKLAVPDSILLKPGRLTHQEYEVIKRHCDDGARIVDRFGPLRPAVSIIRHHHERWSGDGYPARLQGETIPLEASIVGLADAWDAMTTSRPYKAMMTVEEALDEVRRGRGTQFRPDVADAFELALAREPELFAPLEADQVKTKSPKATRRSLIAKPTFGESLGLSDA